MKNILKSKPPYGSISFPVSIEVGKEEKHL